MKILYFQCLSGISGDMNLGAMLDLGVEKDYLLRQLALLGLEKEYEIEIRTAQKMGITGTRVEIKLLAEKSPDFSEVGTHGHVHDHKHGRTLPDIQRMIRGSSLTQGVQNRSLKVFDLLAQAEAKVHGITKEQVHFHEVGAVDAILDIVGAAICLEYLQVDKIIASKIELGGGFVRCAHGVLPVPAPAVVELLRGVPVTTGKVQFETTTPTGAAILVGNVDEYTEQLDLQIEKIGYGIGMRDLEIPNVLRVYLGELSSEGRPVHEKTQEGLSGLKWQNDDQMMLETNIDDMNPEILGYVEDKLWDCGALDVYKTPIIMKKGRPAVKLSVLAPKDKIEALQEIIFMETTAIGVRSYTVQKTMLIRKSEKVETRYGSVRVKFSYLDGQLVKYKAEYEDCKKIAAEAGVPLREIYRVVDLEIERQSHSY